MAGHMAALAVVVWSGRMHNILMQGRVDAASSWRMDAKGRLRLVAA